MIELQVFHSIDKSGNDNNEKMASKPSDPSILGLLEIPLVKVN